jgi:hypothetical protein
VHTFVLIKLKEDFSNYQSNIIVQNGNSEVAVKAAQSLANKHPVLPVISVVFSAGILS